MNSLEHITKCLHDEGLTSVVDEAHRSWTVTFNIDGRAKDALLLHPPEDEYLIAAAFIDVEQLRTKLEKLSASALAQLVRITSDEGMLAKLTYIEAGPRYYATSACSVDGPTGKKLRRRLEACARLAASIEKALSSMSRPPAKARAKSKPKRTSSVRPRKRDK